MSDQQYILENSFWKFLVSLEELTERKKMVLFCSSLAIDEETLENYCEFLTRFKVAVMRDEHYVYPLKEQSKIKLEFSLSEWLALQASIPKGDDAFYFQQIIQNKMQMAQKAYTQFSLFKRPEEHVVSGTLYENIKKKIDYAIVCRKSMKINFIEGKQCDVFPHRLVFLEGILCIVGESIQDKTLVYFGVEDIEEIENLTSLYDGPNLSQIEVNEFIGHLRLINGQEERLVLKFYNQEQGDILPEYHFLGNPFVTASTEGDMIWAATLEMCDDVYNWLYKMRDKVEVLDPGHIRKEFSHFCELKKENSTSKKAS